MTIPQDLFDAIEEGWHTYQSMLVQAIRPLSQEQLALRAAPHMRSVQDIARHVIGARARWFYLLMGEGGDEFKALGRWDGRDAPARSASNGPLPPGERIKGRGWRCHLGRRCYL